MRNLLLSSVTLLLVPAVSVAAPDFPSHTHTYTPIELKPISDIPASLKLASVCFLGAGDCGDAGFNTVGGEDYTRPTSELCIEAGYATTSCALPNYLYDRCPDNDAYYRSCREDKARACKEAGYILSCGDGYILDNTQLCPYDSSYKKCKCNPCDDYAYTYAQATASGYVTDGSCNSCGTIRYKRKENPCSGFKTCDCGGEIGTKTCISGSITKYQVCKECCDATRFIYDASNCSGAGKLSGESCGGKFEKCEQQALILYSDHTTSYEIISGKTPIGIVVDELNKVAAAINNIGFNQTKVDSCVSSSSLPLEQATQRCTYMYSNASKEFGNYDQISVIQVDIPELENCEEGDFNCSPNGKENTKKILAYGKANGLNYNAALFANSYQPAAGCETGSWCSAGNWFVPSMRDLNNLFVNKDTIKSTVKKISGAELIIFDDYKCVYGSSNERLSDGYSTGWDFKLDPNWWSPNAWSFGPKAGSASFILPMIQY
jgi:hypothetical protein